MPADAHRPLGGGRVPLLPAHPIDFESRHDLEVLRAVLLLGVERRSHDGVRPSTLRRHLRQGCRPLRRDLMRLSHAGAVRWGGRWPRRALLLTDAGLATIAAALEPMPSSSARAQRRRTT